MAEIEVTIDNNTPALKATISTPQVKASIQGTGPQGSQGPTGATGSQGAQGDPGSEVQLRVDSGQIQWKLEGELTWNNLLALADITGAQGDPGNDGADGTDGREVELQEGATHIQWRYVGEVAWNDLIAIADITGPQGPQGIQGEQGEQGPAGSGTGDVLGPATNTADFIPQWDGANSKTLKNGLGLDIDLSSVSASDDTIPSAKATKTALDLKQDVLTGLTATVTELNFTDGVTSAIQTQLDGKLTLQAANVINDSGADVDQRIEGDTSDQLFVIDAGLDAVQIGTTVAGNIADFRNAVIVFNEDGSDQDFRVEGDTNANLLVVDASTDRVGIGTATPSVLFEVNGTFKATTLNGDLLLDENSGLQLDSALSADGKYSGITEAGTAGAALAFGDLVYLNNDDSRWELVDANVSDGYDKKLGIVVLAAAADGDPTKVLLWGKVRADTAFPTFTVGAPVYMGETAGDVVVTQPTTADVCIRIMGFGNTADELFFTPSQDYIVHV